MARHNLYFQLTEAFNAKRRIAILCSGQAVVYYRLAIMSKDGDWILEESETACRRVLEVLEERKARYRPGAPLDPRWLRGGWSSHFELFDTQGRRIRCDFFSRPPRVPPETISELFSADAVGGFPVVGVEPLIRMKQTQRAKDYPVIGELARLLSPARELELTTDPDRILELAPRFGMGSERTAVRVALAGEGRRAVVVALAEEIDELQQEDRQRVARYERAARAYLRSFRELARGELDLPAGHRRLCALAERWLPETVVEEGDDEDAR